MGLVDEAKKRRQHLNRDIDLDRLNKGHVGDPVALQRTWLGEEYKHAKPKEVRTKIKVLKAEMNKEIKLLQLLDHIKGICDKGLVTIDNNTGIVPKELTKKFAIPILTNLKDKHGRAQDFNDYMIIYKNIKSIHIESSTDKVENFDVYYRGTVKINDIVYYFENINNGLAVTLS